MNKKQLIGQVAEKAGFTKSNAGVALEAVIDCITEALVAGDSVQLVGFCSLSVKERAERQGINPATKQAITIPAKKVVKFKAGKALEDSIN